MEDNKFKFKIHLNKYQKALIAHHFICSRIIFNVTVNSYQFSVNNAPNKIPNFFLEWILHAIRDNPAWESHKHVSQECINGAKIRAVSAINNLPNSDYSSLASKNSPLVFSIYQNFSVSIEDGAIYIPKFEEPIWGKFDDVKGINICINHLHFSKENSKYFVQLVPNTATNIKQESIRWN